MSQDSFVPFIQPNADEDLTDQPRFASLESTSPEDASEVRDDRPPPVEASEPNKERIVAPYPFSATDSEIPQFVRSTQVKCNLSTSVVVNQVKEELLLLCHFMLLSCTNLNKCFICVVAAVSVSFFFILFAFGPRICLQFYLFAFPECIKNCSVSIWCQLLQIDTKT